MIKIKLLGGDLPTPNNGRSDICNLYAAEAVTCPARHVTAVPLGFAARIPEGYAAFLAESARLAANGVYCLSTFVHNDDRREWVLHLYNTSTGPVSIPAGAEVGVFMLKKLLPIEVFHVGEL